MEEQERQFKGIWIPKEIWLTDDLSLQEKVVLIEIESLEDETKGCYASNKYFANFFKLSPGRISQIINNLVDKEYIDVKYIKNGREIIERQIRIQRPPYPVFRKLNTYLENDEGGIKKTKGGYLENAKENNKYINNIKKNNIYGTYKRIKLTDAEYERLVKDFGEEFIKRQIELLDEYVESNNNKNKYTNFNLVLRKSIRENWFSRNKQANTPKWFNEEYKEEELDDETRKLIEEITGTPTNNC